MSHRVVVFSVETAVMVWAIIKVLSIVIGVVVTVLVLF